MTRRFTFYDDSWWDSVCDCCEPTEMAAFNSDDTDSSLGTAHSIEDCYIYAILTEAEKQGIDLTTNDDSLWEQPLESLEIIAKELDIEVEIMEKGNVDIQKAVEEMRK